MNEISNQEFEELNQESKYKTVKGTLFGMTPLERATALYEYEIKNFMFPIEHVMQKETYHQAVEMQFFYLAEKYRREVRIAFLSPKQLDYVFLAVRNWAIEIAAKKRAQFLAEKLQEVFR